MSFNGKSINVFAHDYETTGVKIDELGVVQSALCFAVLHQDGTYEIQEKDVAVLNPGCNIEPEAEAIHGISNFDVIGAPEWLAYLQENMVTVNEAKCDAVVSFNGNRFDNKIAMRAGWQPLLSFDMYKAASAFKKQGLWEKANLGYSYEKLMGEPLQGAHDAFADIVGTLSIIRPAMLLAGFTNIDDFHKWMQGDDGTAEMKLSWANSKHRGKRLKHIPRDYLQWILSPKCQANVSMELEMGIRAALKAM